MVIAGGYTSQVYFKEEAGAYDSIAGGAVYQYLGPIKSAPFKAGMPRADSRGLNSRIRVHKPPLDHVAELSVEVPLQTDTNWLLIQDIDDATLKQYSLLVLVTVGATTYRVYGRGVYLDEVTVGTETNAVITAKIKFSVGRWDGVYTAAQHTETEEAASTTVPQVWKDGKVTKVVASGWTTTGDQDHVQAWEITIKNNYKKKHGWTNLYPRDQQEEGFDVSGSITFDFENLAELTELLSENEGDIDFFTETTDKITAEDVTFDNIDIDIAELVLLEQKIPFTADDVSFTT
jgi:hypothetical protein